MKIILNGIVGVSSGQSTCTLLIMGAKEARHTSCTRMRIVLAYFVRKIIDNTVHGTVLSMVKYTHELKVVPSKNPYKLSFVCRISNNLMIF